LNVKLFENLGLAASVILVITAAMYIPRYFGEQQELEDQVWYNDWEDIPPSLRTPINATGKLQSAPFPGERSGIAPTTGDDTPYRVSETLYIEVSGDDSKNIRYFLHYGGRTEVILRDTRSGSRVGDVTISEIVEAYRNNLTVTVTGFGFKTYRINETYNLLHVEHVEVHDREKLPLILYKAEEQDDTWISFPDPVETPLSFKVYHDEEKNSSNTIKILTLAYPGQYYHFNYNASGKVGVSLSVYQTRDILDLSDDFSSGFTEIIQTYNESFKADFYSPEQRVYQFLFKASEDGEYLVDFNCKKTGVPDSPMLFMRYGYNSANGGMGSQSLYPLPLPENVTIGRTWSEHGAWTDHEYHYEAYLAEGEIIEYGYNSTEPVKFQLSGLNTTYEKYSGIGYGNIFKVPETGKYRFKFSIDPPGTAQVSAVCRRLTPEIDPFKDKKYRDDLPYDSASTLGELSNYTLVINCSIDAPIEKASIIEYTPQKASEEEAYDIAKKVFGFTDDSQHVVEDDVFEFKEDEKVVDVYGVDRIIYRGKLDRTVIREWNNTKVEEIAESLLSEISTYWDYPTEATYTLEMIKPKHTTGNDDCLEVGAFYRLEVGNATLFGPLADFTIGVKEDTITSAELNMPQVTRKDEVNVTLPMTEAIKLLIRGISDTRKLGYETMYGPIPSTGVCIIDDVNIAYYLGHEETRLLEPYYQVQGRLKLYHPGYGEVEDVPFREHLSVQRAPGIDAYIIDYSIKNKTEVHRENFDSTEKALPPCWSQIQGSSQDKAMVQGEEYYSPPHSLRIHEEGDDGDNCKASMDLNLTGSFMFEMMYKVRGGAADRGVFQFLNEEGEECVSVNCLIGYRWGNRQPDHWRAFRYLPAPEADEWYNVSIIGLKEEGKVGVIVNGLSSEWLDAQREWENITAVNLRGNYNYPADSWYDDIKVSTVEAEKQVKASIQEASMYVEPSEIMDELETRLVIVNHCNDTLLFGTPYTFEKYLNGSWVKVPSEHIWLSVMIILPPGDSFEDTLNVKGLDSGRYRVLKEVEFEGTGEQITLITEFEVDRPDEPEDEIPIFGYRYSLGLSEVSRESPDKPMLEVYNLGTRSLFFDSSYVLEHMQEGKWVKVYEGEPGNVTEVEMGETFTLKIGEPDMSPGDYMVSLSFGIEDTTAKDVIELEFPLQK
jgi:hypothetical protein